jgi:hypothetical protein
MRYPVCTRIMKSFFFSRDGKSPASSIRCWIASALILFLVLGGSGSAFAASSFPDVPADTAWTAAVDRLTLLAIVSGSPDGLFHPDAAVTREQFAKLAITAANLATADNIKQNATPFSDVSSARWSSGYVRTAVKNGMLTGYASGKFKPDSVISYAEVLTVMIRMLGYADSDLTGTWPQNYLSKATTLKLTTGFKYAANSPMSRKDCAVLLNRLLDTDTKATPAGSPTGSSTTGSASGGIPYAESTGLYKTVIILADSSVDRTLDAGEVRTDGGILNNATAAPLAIGRDYMVMMDGTTITKVYQASSHVLSFPVAAVSGGTLYYRTGTGNYPLVLTSDMTFYDNDGPLSYGSVFTDIQAGETVSLSYDTADGPVRYLQFSKPAQSNEGTYAELLVLDTAATSKELPGNQVLTDKGIYTLAVGVAVPSPGTRIGAIANGMVITGINGQVNQTRQATLLQMAGTQAVLTMNGVTETMDLPLSASWYHDGVKVAAASLASLLSRDSSVVFGLSPSGEGYDYALLYDPIYSAPQTADLQEMYTMKLGTIDLNGVMLSRAGDLISVYEIRYSDVAYEVTDIWGGNRYVELYPNTGSETVGAILGYAPNRFSPSTIQISVYDDVTKKFVTKTFSFSTEFQLSDLAGTDFQVGDSAILLLGRDGKIVRMLK